MRTTYARSAIAAAAVLSLGLAACGSDEAGVVEDSTSNAPSETDAPAADAALPNIVVTTNILGDVVEQVVGDAAEVVTIMPVGTDPHDFQASAQEVDVMYNADALIVNGAAFEEGLLDVIEGAESGQHTKTESLATGQPNAVWDSTLYHPLAMGNHTLPSDESVSNGMPLTLQSHQLSPACVSNAMGDPLSSINSSGIAASGKQNRRLSDCAVQPLESRPMTEYHPLSRGV